MWLYCPAKRLDDREGGLRGGLVRGEDWIKPGLETDGNQRTEPVAKQPALRVRGIYLCFRREQGTQMRMFEVCEQRQEHELEWRLVQSKVLRLWSRIIWFCSCFFSLGLSVQFVPDPASGAGTMRTSAAVIRERFCQRERVGRMTVEPISAPSRRPPPSSA